MPRKTREQIPEPEIEPEKKTEPKLVPKPIPVPVQKPKEEPIKIINDDAIEIYFYLVLCINLFNS